MKKTGREFFEVFRRAPETEKSRAWWSGKSAPEGDSGAEATPTTQVAPGTPAAAKPKLGRLANDTTTPPGRLTLTFSTEALVIGGIVLVGVLIGSHVWGYSRGVASRVPRDDAQARQLPPAPSVTVAARPTPSPTVAVASAGRNSAALSVGNPAARTTTTTAVVPVFWTLRIMRDVPSLVRAREVAADLQAKGYDAFVIKSGSQSYTVNVGRFADNRAAGLLDLKEKFDVMQYKGARVFRSCSSVKVTDPGSIEP
jgi:hypothetical protein